MRPFWFDVTNLRASVRELLRLLLPDEVDAALAANDDPEGN